MILETHFIEFDTLEAEHGDKQALVLFEQLKKQKPLSEIGSRFAEQIIEGLPSGFATFDKSEWGLESEDSSSCIYWCEHYYLNIPSVNATAFIEVGDNHYYVNLTIDGENCFDGENLSSYAHIPDVILDMATQLASNI